ncbi:uncharacterized protein ACA1_295650 [Acanthamoeba castellanii str. Neff]|uniref:Uncharacterized protein n=1 Tax=Acanthamoeba castellanii (strain ATCC 30010 / Neff) TaxID=1257118 RepID=L8HIQ0_ACACF|nr:uncharacterized protein ACA1_295650 [Acanthamoeba castellanii str. Neff]ELR25479.1 hypothetical protein ACA1_295650 [Acanthamoeba castellanii str. Neff]
MQDCTADLKDSSEQVHREEEKVTFLLGSHAAPIWVSDDDDSGDVDAAAEGSTNNNNNKKKAVCLFGVKVEFTDDDEGETTDDEEPPQQQQPQQHQQPSMEEPGRAVVCCPNAQKEKKLKKGRFIICWRPGGGWAAQWEPNPSSRSTRSTWWDMLRTKPAKGKLRSTSTPTLRPSSKKMKKTRASPRRSPRRHSSSAAADAAAAARAQPPPDSPSPSPKSDRLISETEAKQRKWDAMYAGLKEWVESEGRLPSRKEAREIYNWLHYNRRKEAWPRRTPTQVARLLALGVAPYGQAIDSSPVPELDI